MRLSSHSGSVARGAVVGLLVFVGGWGVSRAGIAGAGCLASYREVRRAHGVLRRKWDTLVISGARLDTASGPAVLVEFSDYQCPFCRRVNASADSVMRQRPLSVAYHHYPLSAIHPAAEGAARSAICAGKQGRFREMHHVLMTTTGWQADTNWAALADSIQIRDRDAFRYCLHAPATTSELEHDRELAEELGVRGTPPFFTRLASYPGSLNAARLVEIWKGVSR